MEQYWVSKVLSDVKDSNASAPLGRPNLPQVRLRFGNGFFSFLSITIDIAHDVYRSSSLSTLIFMT